jgi:branched-chain amino acid aminotransferase
MAKMDAGRFAYFDGNFVAIEDAKVSILTHAFNYGTGLFEGIRGYYSQAEGKVLIFRLHEHVDRLVRNCNIMCMDIQETPEDIERICCELVKRNGFKEDVYLRPIIYKSEHSLGPKLKGIESKFCCWNIKLGDYVNVETGLDVCVSSWRRLSDNAIPARAKTTGSYVNSALARSEAEQAGFDEAIVLREDGTVSEGSAMNIFMVRDGKLITPPENGDLLVGITRNSVIEIASADLGLLVVERPIARTELYVSDELFFTGTGAQVAPVRSVDRRLIGGGRPGPISKKLQDIYFEAVQGKIAKYRRWCTPVE